MDRNEETDRSSKRQEARMKTTILRLREVERLTQLSKATLYRMMKSGTFPRPVRLGVRAVGWIQTEIESWIADLERA